MLRHPGGSLPERLAALERHRSTDVGERLTIALAIEREATDAQDVGAALRARLVVADMLHRSGDAPGALRLAGDVNAAAADRVDVALLARSHLVLSSIHEAIGDAAAALEHAISALGLVDDTTPERDRGNHLLRLADALAFAGSVEEARHRYQEAAKVFRLLGDIEREVNVLNNLTVLECEAGEVEAAHAAALQLQEAAGAEMNPEFAETIARACLVAGDLDRASSTVALGLRLLAEQGDSQAVTPAELELANAEVALAQGSTDRADEALRRCLDVCERRGLPALRVSALAVQAEVHAARGDFAAAYAAHRTFHSAFVAQRTAQDEAAARALFHTAEARHDAQQFWHQARTDPLTELYNRRYVSEVLPTILARHRDDEDCPVIAALFDVDHFKRINDDFDHTTGDEVLRRLATVFTALAAHGGRRDPSFAARLGGEEFLVVLAGVATDRALRLVEQARRAAAELDWAAVGHNVRVTVSAGVAVADPTDTQYTLLSRADTRLYEAKAAGRDRVVSDRTRSSG